MVEVGKCLEQPEDGPEENSGQPLLVFRFFSQVRADGLPVTELNQAMISHKSQTSMPFNQPKSFLNVELAH